MHKSHTLLAEVTVYGGKIKGVMGGGASSYDNICGCDNGKHWYAGDASKSPCVTDEARVSIYGGEIGIIYGGNEGIGYVKKTTVTVNHPDLEIDYITAGGSNGGTDEAHLIIEDVKKANCVQGVNRGFVKNITIDIKGGAKIVNAYAGAELPCDTTDANFVHATLNIYKSGINQGLTILNASKGGNTREAIDDMADENPLKNSAEVNYI